jgi:basic amino acid/polyamine antiporter, APA family
VSAVDARATQASATLRRALGRWDLTAIGINQVIGGAIFLMPSQVARAVGAWSILFVILTGISTMFVALCFAEAGSRFERTGGAYIYTRAAFGRFIGFEVGWMQWFTRATSQASVVNGIALALAFYWTGAAHGFPRAAIITLLTCSLAAVNIAGIRQSAWFVNALTIAKLAPLLGFTVFGVWYWNTSRVPPPPPLGIENVASAALLLTFTFGGFDVIGVPAGEAIAPRRHVPFALIATIAAVTIIFTLVQIVLVGVLPDLAEATTPIADAARKLFGPAAALAVGVGAILSMTGNNAGQVLSGSRMLFALAEQGDLPKPLARVHPRFRTPSNAIVVTSIAALALALSGSFAVLATVSAVARLIAYAGTAAATLRLRQLERAGGVEPAAYTIPLGPTVPTLALLLSVLILIGATSDQLAAGVAALLVGGALFLAGRRSAA